MLLHSYMNGNGFVEIYDDGSRKISFEGDFKPSQPLNIDIRVSSKCSFGFNPVKKTSVCSFCHESATTDGKYGDYEWLESLIERSQLASGTELAIGANQITDKLIEFIKKNKEKHGHIINLTVNSGHVTRSFDNIIKLICGTDSNVKGLGISYRKKFMNADVFTIMQYKNAVLHVIAGIDDFDDILELSEGQFGIRKILVLGEKDFGFNRGRVDLNSPSHYKWYTHVRKLFDYFDVVSFDNLALEQLNIKRFLSKDQWDRFYQNEHSIYINAVEKYMAPSSRSDNKSYDFDNIKAYFQSLGNFTDVLAA